MSILLCVGTFAQSDTPWAKRSKFQLRQLAQAAPLDRAQLIGAQAAYRTQSRVIKRQTQTKSVAELLDGGVRRFQIDAWVDSGEIYMCNLELPYTVPASGEEDCRASVLGGASGSPLLADFLNDTIAWLNNETTYLDFVFIQITQQFSSGFDQGQTDTVDDLVGTLFGDYLFKPGNITNGTYPTARSLIDERQNHVVVVSNSRNTGTEGSNVFKQLATPRSPGGDWTSDAKYKDFSGPDNCSSSAAAGPYPFASVYEDTNDVPSINYDGAVEVGVIYDRSFDVIIANNIPKVQNCGFSASMMKINDAQLEAFIWNFREDEPTYNTAANCAVVTSDGSWEMRNCGESNVVACYASGSGWSLSDQRASFSSADTVCETGQFLAPKSAGDNYAIVLLMNATQEARVWINYNDIQKENCFSIDGNEAACPADRLEAPPKGSSSDETPYAAIITPIMVVLLCCCCCCLCLVILLVIASIVTVFLVKTFYIDKIDSDYVGTG